MALWSWIIFAAAVAYGTKFAGYLVPTRWLENEHMTRVAVTLTVGLLASLTAMNTLSAGQSLSVDARVGALAVGALALWLRVPFLGVVVGGAATAAGLRAFDIG